MEKTFLCPLSQQEAILEDLRTDIPVHFNFLFSDSHVEVISGKQEGTNESMKPSALMAWDKPRPFTFRLASLFSVVSFFNRAFIDQPRQKVYRTRFRMVAKA